MNGRKSLLEIVLQRWPDFSREQMLARILSGEVSVNGHTVRDPRRPAAHDAIVRLTTSSQYVSRGGVKLAFALDRLDLAVAERVAIDAGASTGGFSDCLLQRGARRVFTVDVGYNQLDYRLRADPRVAVMERRRITTIQPAELDPSPQVAVADLSFRSLRGVAGHLLSLTTDWVLCLVKPQFEGGAETAGFRGVVLDDAERRRIVTKVAADLLVEGAFLHGCCESPIAGRKGNREYFFLIRREPSAQGVSDLLEAAFELTADPGG